MLCLRLAAEMKTGRKWFAEASFLAKSSESASRERQKVAALPASSTRVIQRAHAQSRSVLSRASMGVDNKDGKSN
jgi:hypothetical protein